MDRTISAIGVLVGLLTLIILVLGGLAAFFGIKEKYENEFSALSTSEKPSGDTQDKLDELTKKSEYLEGVGVELKYVDYNNRGLDYYYKEEYKKAKEAFEKAVELKPNYEKAWFNIACIYSLKADKKRSLENLRKAVALDPKYTEKAKKDEDFKKIVE